MTRPGLLSARTALPLLLAAVFALLAAPAAFAQGDGGARDAKEIRKDLTEAHRAYRDARKDLRQYLRKNNLLKDDEVFEQTRHSMHEANVAMRGYYQEFAEETEAGRELVEKYEAAVNARNAIDRKESREQWNAAHKVVSKSWRDVTRYTIKQGIRDTQQYQNILEERQRLNEKMNQCYIDAGKRAGGEGEELAEAFAEAMAAAHRYAEEWDQYVQQRASNKKQ